MSPIREEDKTRAPAPESRFTVFAFLFAAASVFYHAEQSPWFGLVPGVVPLTAAFASLLRPSSVPRFAILVSAQSVHAYLGLPFLNTNRTLQLIVGVTILAALLLETAHGRFRLPSGANWLRAFDAPVRLELATVYLFAFWHKLNWDYLDPKLSCGVALFRDLAGLSGMSFLPAGPWADWLAITATLALEATLPVLLLIPRTRQLAFVGGVAFHIVLGIARYYAFSATMIALLFLFAPPRLSDWLVAHAGGRMRQPVRLALAGAAIVVSQLGSSGPRPLFYWIWLALSAALLAAIGGVLLRGARGEGIPPLFPMPHPVLICLPVLTFVNGACPYLGLKTEHSFAMYSNLRTEGDGPTNHLFLRRKLELASYQDDLVRVIDSSDAALAASASPAYEIPHVWLRRLVWESDAHGTTDIAVTIERKDGSIRHVANVHDDPELGRPPTFLERKFLRFRQILPRANNVCAH